MKKELVSKSEIKLVGLSARTNNKNEMNPQASKIAELAGRFWSQNVAAQILNRKNPGVTLSVYTEYDSNEHGDYTYFIGEEVSSVNNVPEGLRMITIPQSKYQRFTTDEGPMPQVVIQAWQDIWQMDSQALGGNRRFIADFEVYDERATDPTKTIADVYIGIQ